MVLVVAEAVAVAAVGLVLQALVPQHKGLVTEAMESPLQLWDKIYTGLVEVAVEHIWHLSALEMVVWVEEVVVP
jgi:hypothetical protein